MTTTNIETLEKLISTTQVTYGALDMAGLKQTLIAGADFTETEAQSLQPATPL